MYLKKIVWLLVVLSCPFLSNGQDFSPALPVDKNAVLDSLDNGLHYIIHPTNQPNTEFRLVLNVGSLQETQDEKGYAHFLEHMVFNGSEDFPGWQAIDTLQSLGYRYGRDINAYTSYERTVYQLSLQKPAETQLALSILSNFLYKATLDDDAIEKERKIVIQEIKDFGKESAINQKKLEGTKHQGHLPIATEEDILLIKNQKLKEFYKKWYASNLATVIITGNVDPQQAKAEIKKLFKQAKPTIGVKRNQNIYAFNPKFNSVLLKDSNSNNKKTKLEIIRFNNSPLLQKEEDFKNILIESLYSNFLKSKIKEANIKASYHSIWYLSNRTENVFELEGMTKKELLNKTNTIASLINTIHKQKITLDELNSLKKNYIAGLNNTSNEVATYIADKYVDQAAAFSNYLNEENKFSLTYKIIESITVNDLNELHYNSWLKNSDNLYLLINGTDSEALKEKELLKTWNKGLKKKIVLAKTEPGKDTDTINTSKNFTWNSLPIEFPANKTAHLVDKKYFDNIDVTQLTLSNGLRIAIKPTNNTDGYTTLCLFSRNGLNKLANDEYPFFQDTAYFVDSSWIKGMTNDQYNTLGSEKEISTLVSITDTSTIVNTVSRINNLEDLFEWSYRKMFDYEKPQQDFEEYIAQEIKNISEAKKEPSFFNIPSFQLKHKIADYQNTTARKAQELNTAEEWKQIKLDKLFSLYENIVRNSNENCIVISGNFDLEKTIEMAISYFSKMPEKENPLFKTSDNESANFLVETKKIIREKIISEDTKRPEVHIVWKGKINPNLKEYIIAQIIREIFNDEFLKLAREKEGLVYSPYTDIQTEIYPIPQTAISLNFSASEKDIPMLESIAKNVILKIQSTNIEEKLLNRMKNTILNNKNMHLTKDATFQWVEKLRDVYLDFSSLDDFNRYDEILQNITPSDIRIISESIFDINSYGVFLLSDK